MKRRRPGPDMRRAVQTVVRIFGAKVIAYHDGKNRYRPRRLPRRRRRMEKS